MLVAPLGASSIVAAEPVAGPADHPAAAIKKSASDHGVGPPDLAAGCRRSSNPTLGSR